MTTITKTRLYRRLAPCIRKEDHPILRRELARALETGGEAVPVKTVIVYGDHGPEEREPVEDYYDAPPTPTTPAVEALARAAEAVYVDSNNEDLWNALEAALAHPEIAALWGEK